MKLAHATKHVYKQEGKTVANFQQLRLMTKRQQKMGNRTGLTWAQVLRDDLVDDLAVVQPRERWRTSDHLPHHDPEAVHVSSGRQFAGDEQLRGHVRHSSVATSAQVALRAEKCTAGRENNMVRNHRCV